MALQFSRRFEASLSYRSSWTSLEQEEAAPSSESSCHSLKEITLAENYESKLSLSKITTDSEGEISMEDAETPELCE
jgi:hypothetical protein